MKRKVTVPITLLTNIIPVSLDFRMYGIKTFGLGSEHESSISNTKISSSRNRNLR